MRTSLAPAAALEQLGISPALLPGRGLCPIAEATELVVAETGEDGRTHLLIPDAAAGWYDLKLAAKSDGIDLWIVSAFRTIDRQFELVRRKLARGMALEEVLAESAPPGYSEHHSGRAVDVGTPNASSLEACFAETEAFRWLNHRGAEFGFVLSYPIGNAYRYRFEPWHWCYRASQHSAAVDGPV